MSTIKTVIEANPNMQGWDRSREQAFGRSSFTIMSNMNSTYGTFLPFVIWQCPAELSWAQRRLKASPSMRLFFLDWNREQGWLWSTYYSLHPNSTWQGDACASWGLLFGSLFSMSHKAWTLLQRNLDHALQSPSLYLKSFVQSPRIKGKKKQPEAPFKNKK